MTQKKAVFFDRDGTLIVDKIYLNDPGQIEYLDEVITSLKKIQSHGYDFIVVTNQSGIARGIVDEANLFKIHKIIDDFFKSHQIKVLDYLYAPYLTSSNHYYRKPQSGMLQEGSVLYNIDLSKSWMVGDRMTDVEAGHRAGTKSILLSDLEDPSDFDFNPPDAHVHSLAEVAAAICEP